MKDNCTQIQEDKIVTYKDLKVLWLSPQEDRHTLEDIKLDVYHEKKCIT